MFVLRERRSFPGCAFRAHGAPARNSAATGRRWKKDEVKTGMKTEPKMSGHRPAGPLVRILLTRPLIFWLRLGLGSVFVLAAVDKIVHPKAFAEIVHNYQVLPDHLVNLAAIVLPWLEACLGALLLLGVWLPGAVLVSNILLLAFFCALVFNTARGLNVHCGCFSTSAALGVPSPFWYIVRDSVFLLLGGGLFFLILPGRRPALFPLEDAGGKPGEKAPSEGA